MLQFRNSNSEMGVRDHSKNRASSKKLVSGVISILLAIVSIAMFSCEPIETKYTVRFDSKGGTPTPQEQTVKEGGKIAKPANPTRENYTLAGWAMCVSKILNKKLSLRLVFSVIINKFTKNVSNKI